MKKIVMFILSIGFVITMSGCIYPDGPFYYGHDNFMINFESISFLSYDEEVFRIDFPVKTYALDGHRKNNYEFIIENDYRMLNEIFTDVLNENEFYMMFSEDKNISSYQLTTGSTENSYNYTDLLIDNDKVITYHGYLITEQGYLLGFSYDSFIVDGEEIVFPLSLSKSYYEAYIPTSFESIEHGRTTMNGVLIKNRIEVTYDYSYLYVFPGHGTMQSTIYQMENFFHYYLQSPNAINQYIPEPGLYDVCFDKMEEGNGNCHEVLREEHHLSGYIDLISMDKLRQFYITYYNGYEVEEGIHFDFLDQEYILEFTSENDQYQIIKIYPVVD